MKKFTLIVVIVLALFVIWVIFKPAPAAAPSHRATTTDSTTNSSTNNTTETNQISIINFSFQPATITVTAGTTVTWTNNDQTAHTVLVEDESSPDLKTGETYSHTFNNAGTYQYSCGLHPSMTGTVIVK